MGISPRRFPLALETTALDNILSLVWLLVCVVVIVVLAYLFTRYVGGRGGVMPGLSGGTERFRVLARVSLGREQSAALVRAGERYFLLGVAPSGISLVAELTEQEAEAICPPPAGQTAPPSFTEALRTVLKQKKPR